MKPSLRLLAVLLPILFAGCEMHWAETKAIPEAHFTEHGNLKCELTKEEQRLQEEYTRQHEAEARAAAK